MLADTRLCPSCFSQLVRTTCPHCGLELADPRASEVLELGRKMRLLELERQQLIDKIRVAHAAEAARAAEVARAALVAEAGAVPVAAWWRERLDAPQAQLHPSAPAVASAGAAAVIDIPEPVAVASVPVAVDTSVSSSPEAVSGTPAAPTEPPPPAFSAPAASVAPDRRRRLTVPVLLLIVGVSLVGVAAIFFLVYAWYLADIGVKSLIIGGVTLATMIGASVLRRFSLRATAEAIAAIAIILLGLDGWAVRANDLFGAGAMEPAVYAGAAALTIGVICRLWAVISKLRGPDLAATLALPTGVGLLAAGLVPLEPTGAIAVGFLGTAVAGLAHALPAPLSAARSGADSVLERTALAVIGMAALLASAVMLFPGLESLALQYTIAGVVIVLGVAYAVTLRTREGVESLPAARVLAGIAQAIAGAIGASLGWQFALWSMTPSYNLLIGTVVAVPVAVALDRWQPRDQRILPARIAAAVVAGISVAAIVLIAALRAQHTIGAGWTLWHTEVFTAPAIAFDPLADLYAAIAAVVTAVLLFFAPTLRRSGLRDALPVGAAVIAIVGVVGTGIPILIVGTGVVVAAVAIVALARGARRPGGWGAAAAIGALTAYLGGFAMPWLWAIGVLVAIAVPIIARAILKPQAIGAVLLALAPVVVAAVSALIAPSALAPVFGVVVDARAGLVLLQWVALATLAGAAFLRLDAASGRALAVSSYLLEIIGLFALLTVPSTAVSVSTVIGEPYAGIARSTLLLVLLGAVALRRTRVDVGPEIGAAGLGAAALLAPVTASAAIAVLESFSVSDPRWSGLAAAGAAAVVVWLGALTPARAYRAAPAIDATEPAADDAAVQTPVVENTATDAAAVVSSAPAVPPAYEVLVRRASDLGALVTATFALVLVPADFRWAILAVAALGFAAASITRGWAGPVTEASGRVPERRATGVALAAAPRRLFAWPAFAAATLALWLWLDGSSSTFEIEAYVLPPAVGLLLFAVALVWLRRQVEATIAVILSFVLGLVVPALVSLEDSVFRPWTDVPVPSPVRGTVVAVVAAAITLALAWTPARRVRFPALMGAIVALVSIALVAVGRAVTEPAGTAWLLLLVGVAYVSAFGFLRGAPVRIAAPAANPPGVAAVLAAPSGTAATEPVTPSISAEGGFAIGVPAIALGLAALAIIPSLDEPLVVAIALAITGALHIAAAAWHRVPLGAATRWTALAGAVVAAAGSLTSGVADTVELVSLPVAAALLGGATLAMRRRARAGQAWPGEERIVWLLGLATAIAPSIIAVPNDPRTWLVIVGALLAAIGCVVAPIDDATGLKVPSALLLSVGALAMGVRALLTPEVESGEFAALAAGAGALLVAAAIVWMSSQTPPVASASTALAAAGAALVLGVVLVQSEGGLVQATLTAIIGGVIGVLGAALLRSDRWAGIGGVLAVGGLIAALIAIGWRFALVAAEPRAGIEADLWAVAGVGILVAIGIMALRSTASRSVANVVSGSFSLALVLFAGAEVILLGGESGTELRAVLTMSALTVVGVIGWLSRERLGPSLAPTAAVLAATFGLLALTLYAVRPVELVTVPPALGMIVLGAHALRTRPETRTWPTLGPGLALLTLPSLIYDFGSPSLLSGLAVTSLWRVVALGIVAIALVVIGAIWRLQAPLLLGSAVLIVHAVAQLWPWISSQYTVIPWWLWLGIGGALLIFIAARYERRMQQFRAAFTAVTSLR